MLLAKGAFVGGLQYALSHTGGGNDNKFTADGFARSLAIGALSAGAASAIGGIAQNIGGVNGTIFQAGAHALSQGVFSTLQGGSFQSGVASGLFGSISAGNGGSALDMIGSAAFVGGMASAENGEGFWKGAAQAGIVAGFNHVGHRDGIVTMVQHILQRQNSMLLS